MAEEVSSELYDQAAELFNRNAEEVLQAYFDYAQEVGCYDLVLFVTPKPEEVVVHTMTREWYLNDPDAPASLKEVFANPPTRLSETPSRNFWVVVSLLGGIVHFPVNAVQMGEGGQA